MIVTENITINGKEFSRSYSSLGFYIERDGIKYGEAVDILNSGYEYAETDEYIEGLEENASEEDYLKALAELGLK